MTLKMSSMEKMTLDKVKRVLHPSYLSLKVFFKSWGQFFWAEMYNLALLFTAVYMLQKWFLFHKLRLWFYWVCVIVFRKFMAGAFFEPSYRLNGYTVVITGADSGIGKEVAKELTLLGAHIVLGSRDLEKAERTKKELLELKGSVEVRHLDLSSLESVRAFANGLINHKYHIHMLINTAGEMMTPYTETTDGLEQQLATNHLGTFLLTNLLLPWITHKMPGKVVNVGATAHIAGELPFGDPKYSQRGYSKWQAYCNSKLATLLFTKHLAKKVKGTNVSVYCANPGTTHSSLYRHVLPAVVYQCPLWGLLLQTPKEAAQTILHCAMEATDDNGATYYSECNPGWASTAAEDDSLAERWWQESERLVDLRDSHKRS